MGLGLGIACGPSASSDTGGDAGSGSADDGSSADDGGTSADDDGGPTSSASADSGDGTATDGTDTGGDACAPAYNEEGGTAVTVSIVNSQDVPIFVGYPAGCLPEPFKVETTDGAQLQWRGGDCQYSCEDVLVDGCFVCGPCPGNGVIRIEPGATYEREWNGGVYGIVPFPAGCLEMPCDSMCERRTAAPEGAYTITAVAGTQCEADLPEYCECPDGMTSCEIYPIGPPDASLEVSGMVTTPTDTQLQLTF
jgi:hypothetical protein